LACFECTILRHWVGRQSGSDLLTPGDFRSTFHQFQGENAAAYALKIEMKLE